MTFLVCASSARGTMFNTKRPSLPNLRCMSDIFDNPREKSNRAKYIDYTAKKQQSQHRCDAGGLAGTSAAISGAQQPKQFAGKYR